MTHAPAPVSALTSKVMNTSLATNQRRLLSYRRVLADQRQLIRELQQVIQPAQGGVDDIDGMRIAVRCTSADPGLHVGGDWYLSMPLANGDLLLAVGDAVGHGLGATGLMLRLRYAMAAFAAEDDRPGAVLRRLNSVLHRRNAAAAATAVVARYCPVTAEFTWARAGHPPMLLADRNGVTSLPDSGGPLLGACASARYPHTTRLLQPGDQIVMYTDGLFPRHHDIEELIHTLATRVQQAPNDPTAMLEQLDYRASGDDACVLIAQRIR